MNQRCNKQSEVVPTFPGQCLAMHILDIETPHVGISTGCNDTQCLHRSPLNISYIFLLQCFFQSASNTPGKVHLCKRNHPTCNVYIHVCVHYTNDQEKPQCMCACTCTLARLSSSSFMSYPVTHVFVHTHLSSNRSQSKNVYSC